MQVASIALEKRRSYPFSEPAATATEEFYLHFIRLRFSALKLFCSLTLQKGIVFLLSPSVFWHVIRDSCLMMMAKQ